jgi:hypothetical protein
MTNYTIFFCIAHQRTFIVEGYRISPDTFRMCRKECEDLDWYNIGGIHIDLYGFITDTILPEYRQLYRKEKYIYQSDGSRKPIAGTELAFWHSEQP